MTQQIFVFGSNLAGRHGRGSAEEAVKKHGAIYGVGIGLQGASYAIPTKYADLKIMPIDAIKWHVEYFEFFAHTHSQWQFNVVAIGCGLAGYQPRDIAPLFQYRPRNVVLPPEFQWSNLK